MKKYFGFLKEFKPSYIILTLIFLLSISCKIVVAYLSSNYIYIYFNRILNDQIQKYLLYIAIMAFGILLVITLKGKTLKIVITIACILFIFVNSILSDGFWSSDNRYFEFKSPNNKTIVVEECSWLLGGSSNVYQKTSSNIVCGLKGNISTDDGYMPFSNNDFNLEWSINSVKITYGFGNGSIQKSQVIKLK